jgi:hypothetical protein
MATRSEAVQQTSATQHIRLPRDSTSGALITIDDALRRIMEGAAFHVSDSNVIANTNSRTLLLTTPNTTARIYLSFGVGTNALVQYYLYENPTISNVGTDVTAYNRDRNSSAAPALTVKHTPTISNVGTELTGGYLISNNINSERIEDRLWVLKQNEEYLVRVTNNSGGNANITILLDWYEE